MSKQKPRLSIGLPVFNGENYLEAALDSILGQTYSDFELIISDNDSTDRTEEICRAYAARDPRIRYYRNEVNIGGGRNFNRVFELARAEYFKWHAHDDVLAREYLEKCIAVLESDPSLLLVHSKTARIEEDGVVVGNFDHQMKIDAGRPRDRFRSFVMERHIGSEQFGILRAEALKATPGMGNYVGCDRNLFAELALRGPWRTVPEHLFLRRQHRDAGTNIWPVPARLVWYEPGKKGRINFPHCREVYEHFKCIVRVPLSWFEKLRCLAIITRYAFTIRKALFEDVWIALIQFVRRSQLGRNSINTTRRVLGLKVRADKGNEQTAGAHATRLPRERGENA